MSAGNALTIAGLALTVGGALVLSYRDLRGGSNATWDDVGRGLPRRESWVGFPLVALGAVLQIVAVAIG